MKKRDLSAILAAAALILALAAGFLLYNVYFLKEPMPIQLGNEPAILGSYVEEMLQPAYLPQQLIVEHKLIDTGEKEGTNYTYAALWQIPDSGGGQIYAFLHYNQNLTALSDLGVLIELNKTVALDEETASTTLKEYIKQNYTVTCESGSNSVVICEDFTTTKSAEYGAGVVVAPRSGFTLVFSCKHFKGGELFGMGTCIKRG